MQRVGILVSVILGSFAASARAADVETKFYGFILPKYVAASNAVSAANAFTNLMAPMAASLPSALPLNPYARASWQIAQTRFGFAAKVGTQISAKLELDFINPANPQPEFFGMYPRLRLATVRYVPSDTLTLFVGQDYDIFSGGTNPFTYNVVGAYLQAGNAGTIRQQVGATWGGATGINASLALGMPSKNDTATAPGILGSEAGQELTMIPSIAASVLYKDGPKTWFGVTGIVSRVLFSASTNDAHLAYGASAVGAHETPSWGVRAKLYYGQNLNNLNALTLASGGNGTAGNSTTAFDFPELGGFVSGRATIMGALGAFGGFGYATCTGTSSIPVGNTSNILTSNLKAEGGLEYAIMENLRTYGQYSFFNSTYTLPSTTTSTVASANVVELGVKFDI